ncbi:hypothetical protein Tco_1004795 [Tanacetum coccineum]|uniref:Uncharacterized protein n=1 Tax=Tanacetum coccineum TaxID=301880 RepID=A0ABQ5FDC8_9ASTR
MFEAKHRNGYANVAWLLAKWMKKKGVGSQTESLICCGQFITRIARGRNMLNEDVHRSLSAPIYCRALDATTLRELTDTDGRLIREAAEPAVPRAAAPRNQRASMQDLYDTMGVFEHMAGVYNVPLQGQEYAQPQYDQFYQQYYPQQQHQQTHGHDDDNDEEDDE